MMNPDDLVALVNEKYDDGDLFLGDDDDLCHGRISTSIPVLDKILGGGFPRGRISELVGDYSSGKSTLALLAASAAQKDGGVVAYIDAEKTYDREWAIKLGVNVADLVVGQPNTGEKAFNQLEKLVRPGAGVDLVIIDSIAQLVPTAEAEEDMEQQFMGLQARLINKGLRKTVSSNDDTAVVAINQLRQTIGKTFGNPEVLPGGRGHVFLSSIILRVWKGAWLTKSERRIGYVMKFKTEKNKTAPPWQECEAPFYYSGSIDREDGLIIMGTELGLVERSGAHYKYKDVKGYGKDKFGKALRENPEVLEELKEAIEKGEENDG